ncbi:MAG TPA: RNA polymerase sigma factor [Planctomycetota bacterium]|nr:RNA polymerase sigma factor [Planctomycetota bacterium]
MTDTGDENEVVPSDADLIAAHLAKDPTAFRRLYDKHIDSVHALVKRELAAGKDRERIEAVCEDVFVRVWKSLGTFKGEASFTTWLTTIVRNACADEIDRRKKDRARARPLEAEDDAPAPAGDVSLETNVVDAIERALAEIPPDQAEAWRLKHKQGLTYAEVGRRLGVSLPTAQSRVEAATAKLKDILARFGE